MFTAEEMAALVRIARCGEGEDEVSRRLRAWLARERKDVFLDLGLDGASIGMAKDIARLLVATFPPRSAGIKMHLLLDITPIIFIIRIIMHRRSGI